MNIFQDKYFPQTFPVTALEHTKARESIENTIENCVDFIDYHGEFTVVMWYYRGKINDKSLICMATQRN